MSCVLCRPSIAYAPSHPTLPSAQKHISTKLARDDGQQGGPRSSNVVPLSGAFLGKKKKKKTHDAYASLIPRKGMTSPLSPLETHTGAITLCLLDGSSAARDALRPLATGAAPLALR